MRTVHAQLRRPRRGAAVLQMVLLLPLLLMIGFGIVEYASFIYVRSVVQAAAREAARESIRSTATNASVQAIVTTAMADAGLQGSGYTLALSPSNMLGLPTGQAVSVTLSLNWGNVGFHPLPSGLGGIPNSKGVTSTVVMNRE